jgi:hypothetical protein
MRELDENRDEVRLSTAIVERLQGRFRLTGTAMDGDNAPLPVDVAATNEQLVLRGRRLDEFTAVPPTDGRVMQLEEVLKQPQQLLPMDIVLLLLCGGMSFRSGGEIHPLKAIHPPQGGRATSLLERQLNRLDMSPLREATCYIVATPLNDKALNSHLATIHYGRAHLYTGGLAPTLSPSQQRDSPPIVMREVSGDIAYNPIGHLEALRWFILSGMLSQSMHSKVAITASYSNWGRIFTGAMVAIAGTMDRLARNDPSILFLVEVTRRLSGEEKGSMLVAGIDDSENLRLVKPSYGRGEPRLAEGPFILLSTNTLYFSIPALVARLQASARAVGISTSDSLLSLLHDAARGLRRSQLADLFEASFPVEAQLIPTYSGKAVAYLRPERDLDQLTLIPGPSLMRAVEVGPDRAVFLKMTSDFENPAKLAYLLES